MAEVNLVRSAMFDPRVGDPDTLLTDGDDATYMEASRSAGGGASNNSATLAALMLDPAQVTAITITVRAAITTADPAATVPLSYLIYDGGSDDERTGSWMVATDGAFHTYSAAVDVAFASMLAAPIGTAWVDVGFGLDPANPMPVGYSYTALISELALIVVTGETVTYRRTFPRDDSLAGGSGRNFPRPRSIQSSNRIGGAYL